MKIRVNIFSADRGGRLDWVEGLTEAVPVFHTSLGVDHEIGSASEYEAVGEDLWATVDVPEGCPYFSYGAGLFDGARLKAVIITDWPRQVFIELMARVRPARSTGTN